jgi:ketosteroid isomerase-like protein
MQAEKGGTLMSQQNVSLVQSLYEAFGRGDIPAILGAMDPDFVWNIPQAPDYPLGGIHRGPQGIANEFFSLIPTYYQEFAAIPRHVVDDGDQVIVLAEYRGKGKASGTPFQVPVVHVYNFRDGKWIRFQEYTDTGTIAAALK